MRKELVSALMPISGKRKNSKAELNGFEYNGPILKRLWKELNRDKRVKKELEISQDTSNGDLNFVWANGSAKMYGVAKQ